MGEVAWMKTKPFGLMVHYLKHIMPKEGQPFTDWDEMVNKFPVKDFCKAVEDTGAGWLIFPFGQNNGYYCSPNPVLEKILPGHCSKRDLMMEVAEILHDKDIKLIAYLPSEVDHAPEEIRNVFEWDLHSSDKSAFQEKYMDFIRCYGEKFGELLDGWWFDGCYNSAEKSFCRTREWTNDRFDYEKWSQAAKAGNHDAVIAMCPGAEGMGYVFKEQDYLAGEVNTLNHFPGDNLIGEMQWHALIWLDCFWMHKEKPGLIVPPRFSDAELLNYIKACHEKGGAVTLNVGIYQDGTMAEATIRQVQYVYSEMMKSTV